MSETNKKDDEKKASGEKKTLSLSPSGTLELKSRRRVADVSQTFSHGRTNSVKVEVRRKRVISRDQEEEGSEAEAPNQSGDETLTSKERQARMQALENSKVAAEQAKEEAKRKAEEDAIRAKEEAERKANEPEPAAVATGDVVSDVVSDVAAKTPVNTGRPDAARPRPSIDSDLEKKKKKQDAPKKSAPSNKWDNSKLKGKLTLSQVLAVEEEGDRVRSEAAVKRARQKQKSQSVSGSGGGASASKQIKEIILPETITVQELSNRMAVRASALVKSLMQMGTMVTVNQVIEADMAELLIIDAGYTVKRVSESDVESGLKTEKDNEKDMKSRPPVITVMGHVDHGKTSLLDALKKTDVVAKEAGGITQHIGAYKVNMKSGDSMTFIDTPGHAAFTEMRARGANATDIVVLVVAGDDGIMEQTIEAISHAKAAEVPMIVAINKMDKPESDANRVRTELLSHEIVVEEMSGDVLSVEVSAQTGMGLEKLEEAILLQAELMDLKANPNRKADGVVVEAKVEQGRGSVATVLIQRGTLKRGDIFVAGATWGKVRALINDKGKQVKEAGPSDPVEVLGLDGTPFAGDEFVVVESEAKARDVAEYRQRKERQTSSVTTRSTMDQLLSQIQTGEVKDLPIIVKTDVHGSLEAIKASLEKLSTEEVKASVIATGVGGINETDISLAAASNAQVVAFNVRANPQARELAKVEGIEIKYYSIIYNIIEDIKAMLSGMLAPTVQEDFIGYAEIRQVFNMSKYGKVAGCFIKEGTVKRGAGVRLLRDDVVIHEGTLKTLKRFKDEVKEVKEGYECGMAFENYDDIKEGDVVECFETKEVARNLD